MKFKNIIIVSTLALSMISFTNTQYASATDLSNESNFTNQDLVNNSLETNTNSNDVDIIKLNNSSLMLEIKKDVDIKFNENDEVTLSKNENSETLPTHAYDENGQYVKLVYKQVEGGLVVELHKNEIMLFAKSSKWKCALGTLGGYYTGAVVGGGAGAGALVGGVGALPGAVGGAILGAVGGGLTGAAEYCF